MIHTPTCLQIRCVTAFCAVRTGSQNQVGTARRVQNFAAHAFLLCPQVADKAIPQGSVIGLFLFALYINFTHFFIAQLSTLFALFSADYTSFTVNLLQIKVCF